MSRKQFDASRATSRLSETLAQRYQRDSQPPTDADQPAPDAAPDAASPPAAGGSAISSSTNAPLTPVPDPSPMVTRSWYLSREIADQLTAAADDLRHTVPALTKSDALAALITAGIERRDEVAAALLERARDARSRR